MNIDNEYRARVRVSYFLNGTELKTIVIHKSTMKKAIKGIVEYCKKEYGGAYIIISIELIQEGD